MREKCDAPFMITPPRCLHCLSLLDSALPAPSPRAEQGHEMMGVVEEVGPEVKTLQRGDRVVVSFDIGGPKRGAGRPVLALM